MDLSDIDLVTGSAIAEVPVSDVRSASLRGWSLTSGDDKVPIEGSRLVYAVSRDTGERMLVAVLSRRWPFGTRVERQIRSALRHRTRRISAYDVVNIAEACDRLRITEKTWHKWKKAREFPAPFKRVGPYKLYDYSELAAFKDARLRYAADRANYGRSNAR